MNIERPTSNAEQAFRTSTLDVRCSVFDVRPEQFKTFFTESFVRNSA